MNPVLSRLLRATRFDSEQVLTSSTNAAFNTAQFRHNTEKNVRG